MQDPWARQKNRKLCFASVLHLICSHSRPLACKSALAEQCWLEPLRQEAQGLCFLLLRIGGGQLDLGRRERGRSGERGMGALRKINALVINCCLAQILLSIVGFRFIMVMGTPQYTNRRGRTQCPLTSCRVAAGQK
jgi:hypothetical protein